MSKKQFFFVFLAGIWLLVCQELMGQVPGNDPCNFAEVILIPDDGDTCINGTTLNATSDGIFNPCDSITTTPLPPGGHEVWYSYVATGTTNTITVSPSGPSPAQFVSVTIANGNCGNSGYIACDKALFINDISTVSGIFTAGTRIWFSVTALDADGDFSVCVSSVTPPPVPAPGIGVDCATAIPICDKHTFVSPGPVFNNATGPISCYAFGPQNILWYKFTAGTNDSLIWLATPNPGYELDWAVYDITAGCPGTPVACNFATTGGGGAPTGMVSGSPNPCGPISQICTPIVLTAGNTYALQFNIENFLNVGIDTPAIKIEWGGIFKMAPYAAFTISNAAGCDSVTTGFINNSVGATQFQWDFGNGNTSSLANPPVQTYTVPGIYLVSLIASNPLSCAHVSYNAITVYPKPQADFMVSDTILCMGSNDSVAYAFAPDPDFTYNWNFAGASLISGIPGTAGPYVLNWNTPGIKNLQLTITDTSTGCNSLVFADQVTVIALPDSTFSLPVSAYEGQPVIVNFTGIQAPGSVYNWNFGGGSVQSGTGAGPYSVSFATAGTYTVSLGVDLNGCFSDDTNSITITSKPVSNAGNNRVVCSGESIQIGAPSNPGYTYAWIPGNALSDSTLADPVFVFQNGSSLADTLFYSLVTSSGLCSDTDFVQVIIFPAISSSFTLSDDTLCGPETMNLSYTGNATSAAVYNWNFAGGNAVSTGGQQYTVDWPASIQDTISLFVVENGCSSDTTSYPFIVGDQPNAVAGPDRILCSGSSDTLGTTPIPGETYSWSPSSGLNNTALSNPVISPVNLTALPDTIRYVITVTSGFCQDLDTAGVIVKPVQQATINGPAAVCINNASVQFVNNYPQVAGASFLWNFGQAIPSNSLAYLPPAVSFLSPGNHQVLLSVQTPGCGSDSDSFTITVYDVPNPGFTFSPASGCPPLTVSFTDTTTTPSGSSFFWDFGNGDSSTQQNPEYVYQQSGHFDVSLTVTTPDSCTSTITRVQAIQVFDLPVPLFTAEPPVTSILNPLVFFASQSLNTDSCRFLFGDGTFSWSCNSDHLYLDTGSYLVQLIAISPEGCIDSAEQVVRVDAFETFYLANAFTPNSDGRNDILIFSGSPHEEFHAEIFNRWGQLIFESDRQDKGWDGKDLRTGKDAMAGVYAYRILFRAPGGKRQQVSGHVTLIR